MPKAIGKAVSIFHRTSRALILMAFFHFDSSFVHPFLFVWSHHLDSASSDRSILPSSNSFHLALDSSFCCWSVEKGFVSWFIHVNGHCIRVVNLLEWLYYSCVALAILAAVWFSLCFVFRCRINGIHSYIYPAFLRARAPPGSWSGCPHDMQWVSKCIQANLNSSSRLMI